MSGKALFEINSFTNFKPKTLPKKFRFTSIVRFSLWRNKKSCLMSNRKNIKVESAFLSIVQERFKTQEVKVDPSLRKRSWAIQFAELLNRFIHQDLALLDPNLYQKVYAKNGGEYPSPKTISRAFVKEGAASLDLLHICGWYLFGENWTTEQQRFDFSKAAHSKQANHAGSQVSNLDAGGEIKVIIKNTRATIDQIKAGQNITFDISNDTVEGLD